MQYALKNRETVTGQVTVLSAVVDVASIPLLTASAVVYAVSGTGPSISFQIQTSDDLLTWATAGSSFNLAATGMQKAAFRSSTGVIGRYVRFQIAVAGTNPLFNYSLWLNTFEGA
jgi:hypothetical protein